MTNYEVTIEGIGKRPLVCIIQAKSAGYAGRLAKDKYGDWITITSTREIELQQKPTPRARRRQVKQDKELKLPTWKTKFTEEAKKEQFEKASRREAIAQALDRKRDEATFK